jgi:hypothetical protein
MRSKQTLAAILLLSLSACMSVISIKSDEEAWNEYFSEWKKKTQTESRAIASSSISTANANGKSGLKILRQMLDLVPLRNDLISCENRECFQSRLVIAFDEAVRRLKDQGIAIQSEDYVSEQKTYLETYSYETMTERVDAFHRAMLSGIEVSASARVKEFESNCASSINSVEAVHLEGFQGMPAGIAYLPKAYYQCLSQGWNLELNALLSDTAQRLGISIRTDDAKKWIIDRQIVPVYRKSLSALFLSRRDEEMKVWNHEWSTVSAAIDWKKPIEDIVRDETPKLRRKFHFINVESLLTAHRLSLK